MGDKNFPLPRFTVVMVMSTPSSASGHLHPKECRRQGLISSTKERPSLPFQLEIGGGLVTERNQKVMRRRHAWRPRKEVRLHAWEVDMMKVFAQPCIGIQRLPELTGQAPACLSHLKHDVVEDVEAPGKIRKTI